MKKFAAGLIVFAAGLCLGAQEALLPESFWPEQRLVTEMRALHDLRGGVYIPYIAEDAFRILRSGPGLSLYTPEGFDGDSLGARKLKAAEGGSERYLAFIGRRGEAGESICLFGFGFWDDLSWCPLPETEAATITDYALVPSGGGGVGVYTLAEGRLRSFSTGIRGAAPGQIVEISRPGERVEAFEVRRERDRDISYGWYRVAHKDYWEVTLFSLDNAGNLVAERTGARASIPRLAYGVSAEGKAVFVIAAGSAVSVFHAEGPGFTRDLYFEAPFKAKQYSPALLTGFPLGLLIGEADGGELLYGVSHERSGAPALRELFAGPRLEILNLFFVDKDRISLIYRSGETLGAALLDSSGGVIDDRSLPVSAEGAVLFRSPLEGKRLRVLSEAASKESSVLTTLEFEGEAWRPAGTALIPRFVPEEIDSLTGVRDGALFLMASPEKLMLLDIETFTTQTLEAQIHDRTGALNGVVYLAFYSQDGIALRRIEE
jgi:hypothetical protein